jgi:hypothetical protein
MACYRTFSAVGPSWRLSRKQLHTGSMTLYTDEWQSYRGSHPAHATVRHGVREWARDDDGDGQREVLCNTCEVAGAALCTYLRTFQGVHHGEVRRCGTRKINQW